MIKSEIQRAEFDSDNLCYLRCRWSQCRKGSTVGPELRKNRRENMVKGWKSIVENMIESEMQKALSLI